MFIGSSLHNQAFCKMFQHLLSKLENFDEHQHDDKMLHKLLRFHYLIKGWDSSGSVNSERIGFEVMNSVQLCNFEIVDS